MNTVRTAPECHIVGFLSIVDNLLGSLISESVIGADDCPSEPMADNLGKRRDFEHRRESELVFVRPERTEFVGKLFRKHRDCPVHQIHRCASRLGLLVHDRSRSDIIRNIGNMYTDLVVSIVQFLE